MAHISTQYVFQDRLSHDDEIRMKTTLYAYQGIKRITYNRDHSILCIDYHDHNLSREQIEQCLNDLHYRYTFMDSVIFLG